MAEHFIRPREGWLAESAIPWEGFPNSKGQPYKAPPFRGWDHIDTIVIHYPGADWEDMDFTNDGTIDFEDTEAQIRLQHRHYALNRHYSLGYCYLIGPLGDIWESRGIRNANAANLGDSTHGTYPPPWNDRTVSIQLIVDWQDAATEAQVAAVNWLIDWLISQRGRSMALTFHSHGQSTQCPGDGVRAQIQSGVIGIGKSKPSQPEKPTIPPIFPEVPDVANPTKYAIYKPTDCDAQFLGMPDEKGNTLFLVWVDKQRADAWQQVGVLVYDQLSLGGFINCVLLGPVPSGDTRHNWTGAEFFRVVA